MAQCPKCGKKALRLRRSETGMKGSLYIHKEHLVVVGGMTFNMIDESCYVPD